MKKILILLVTILLFLPSCVNQKDPNASEGETGSAAVSDINHTGTDAENENEAPQDLLITDYEGCMTKDGFYYLKNIEEDNGGYSIITHLNAPSMLEIPLCNKPNCKHTDDTCNAYVKSDNFSSYLFTDQKKLYLLTEDESSMGNKFDFSDDDIEQNGDGVFVQRSIGTGSGPQTIYSMNLDGTNRTKIMEVDAKVRLEQPYILSGSKLYSKRSEPKEKQIDKNSYTTINENEELVYIDLEKKTMTSLCGFKDKNIVGIYNDKLVIESQHSDIDPNTLPSNDESAYLHYYDNIDRSISTFDMKTQEEKVYLTAKTTKLESVIYEKNLACYFDKSEKKVKKLDLDTGKVTDVPILMKKPLPCISKIVDNKLIYAFYEDKQVNAEMETYFYYDFATGENKEMSLFIKSGEKFSVDVIDEIGDSYLVIPKHDEEKEDTWAGTVQYNIIKRYYALIKKSDYFSSKANYNYFEEE